MIDDSLIGRRLDEYRLDDLVGQGGMARVYRGMDLRLKRWVAIKVIDKPFRADQDYTTRFQREAQAIAQLEHPHIIRLYRYGEAEGLLYMVLQYSEGLPLNQILGGYRQDGKFIEPQEASRIIREIGSALDYAHSRGVIHRDVKPANIILTHHGNAMLVDFGLALLTDTGTRGEAFGTPHYMAPEQVRSSFKVVPQSDLYALGVILYEMFTGQVPFEAEDPLDVAILHMTEPPPPPRQFRPDLDPALEAVILRVLAKEPEERYASGLALANALDRALKIAPATAAAAPPPTLTHLSIPERVRDGLTERPLPPLPAGVSDLAPELLDTAPAPARPKPQAKVAPSGDRAKILPAPEPVPPPAADNPTWPIYVAVGAGLLILLAILLGTALLTSMFLQQRGSAPGSAQNPLPVETSPPAPPETPPPPPASEPQLVADTQRDFSGAPGGPWEYLWSDADENDFEGMGFEERKYGACWYARDYVRICQGSGHPGTDQDIAWRWRSNFSGHIIVRVSARKIDAGGDGVAIVAYRNGQAVEGLRLDGSDTQGVSGKTFFETDVQEGDQIVFVMKRNGQVEYDHTAFQAQIYRQ